MEKECVDKKDRTYVKNGEIIDLDEDY